MEKKTNSKHSIPVELNNQGRETKLLNVICNTSLLLMSIMTEAFTDVFTKLSKEMITAITTEMGTPLSTIKEIHGETEKIQHEFPKQMREQLLAMKTDIAAQLREKKRKISIHHHGWKIRRRNRNRRALQFQSPKIHLLP